MVDSLSEIFRAEADLGSGGGPLSVDLAAVAGVVWEFCGPLAEAAGLAGTVEMTPVRWILGDRARHIPRHRPGTSGTSEPFAGAACDRARAISGHEPGLALVGTPAARQGERLKIPGVAPGFALDGVLPAQQRQVQGPQRFSCEKSAGRPGVRLRP